MSEAATLARKREPPVREDGRCVVCEGERSDVADRYLDPFCSTNCCRKWHETEA